MENKKIMAFVLTGALASGTIGAGSTVYAVENSTDYVLTIPATLAVENAGWNATEGITAKVKEGDTFDSTKKLKVTASSGDSWALEAEGVTDSIGYNLAAATGTYSSTAEAASWEFSADELKAESGAGTKKDMGIIVEDYSTMPAGNYQDTVTFTATVESAVVPVTGVSLNKSSVVLLTESVNANNSVVELEAVVSPATATDKSIVWTSDNDNIATVDQNGKVTAVATGTTTIRATASGFTASCIVNVNMITFTNRDYRGAADFTTSDGIVNVSFTNPSGKTFRNDGDSDGWFFYGANSTTTVTAADGYTIDKVKFYTKADRGTGVAEITNAPFTVYSNNSYHTFTGPNGTGTDLGAWGVNKIEVYFK